MLYCTSSADAAPDAARKEMGSESSAPPASTASIPQTTDTNAPAVLRPRPVSARPLHLRSGRALPGTIGTGAEGPRSRPWHWRCRCQAGPRRTAHGERPPAEPAPGRQLPRPHPRSGGSRAERDGCTRTSGRSRPVPRFEQSTEAAPGPDPRALPGERSSPPSAAEAPPELRSARPCLARTPARAAALCLRAASPARGAGLPLPRIAPAARVPDSTKGRRHRRRRGAQPHRDTRDVLLALVGHGAALPVAERCSPHKGSTAPRPPCPPPPGTGDRPAPPRPVPPVAPPGGAPVPAPLTGHPAALAGHRPPGAAHQTGLRTPDATRPAQDNALGSAQSPLLGRSRGSGR